MSRCPTLARGAIVALLLCLLSGCLVLSGQRITWRYDAAADRLDVLIHYDGVFDNGESGSIFGSKKTPEAVLAETIAELRERFAEGDVMLVDWFGAFSWKKARESVTKGDVPEPYVALWEHAKANVRTQMLGRYRDSKDRLGVVQLVTIGGARRFVELANDAINFALVAAGESKSDNPRWRRVHAGWRAAARAGHDWIALDGHAIVVRLPMHRGAWGLAKFDLLWQIHEQTRRANAGAAGAEEAAEERAAAAEAVPVESEPDDDPKGWFQLLAGMPVSVLQEPGEVVFRLGYRREPATLRIAIRDGYVPNLEETLTDLVPTEVDRALAARVLGDATADNVRELEVLHAWGPPEAKVRALLWHAGKGGDKVVARVADRLERLGVELDERGEGPLAPARGDSGDADYLTAWRDWHARALAHPRL